MNHVYCHGDLVPMRQVDDWWVCGGCGHDLWPVDATFEVDPKREPREEDEDAYWDDVRKIQQTFGP